jgi:hypothetical protein
LFYLLMADRCTSVGRFARDLARIRADLRLFLEESVKLRASLADEGGGKLAGGPLPFSGEIFHSHVQQRDVLLKQAQSSFNSADAVRGRKHGKSPMTNTQ